MFKLRLMVQKGGRRLLTGGVFTFLVILTANFAAGAPQIAATQTDTLLSDADGSGGATPGDTIEYSVTLANSGDMDATNVHFSEVVDSSTTMAAGSVKTSPLARNDSYNATGNVGNSVSAVNGVLANDGDPDGGAVTVTAVQGSSGNVASATDSNAAGLGGAKGSVTLAADGEFTYSPPPGYTGSDTFTYEITDDEGQMDTAIVTITIGDMIWFIDNSYVGTISDGRLGTPFKSIAAFEAQNGGGGAGHPQAGDTIFLYSGSANYSGPLTLENTQTVIGQGAGDTISNISGITPAPHSSTLPSTGGARPVMATSGITLAQDNTLRGLNIGSTGSNTGLSGSSISSLSISEMGISGSGRALNINGGGTVNITLDQVQVTSSGNGGFLLQSISGGATNLSNVTITTSGGTGLLASSANTLNVTGSGNTINAGGGPAVNISNTIIGGSGVTLQSVSAQTADKGIILNNSGTGDFTVTGTGNTDGSGGTIQNINDRGVELTGAQDVSLSNMNLTNAALTQDAAPSSPACHDEANGTNTGCNAPVYMLNASNISLTNLTINGSVQHGINGNNVTGFSISNSDLSSIGNQDKENGMHFINLLGTVSFDNVTVNGSDTRNVLVENNTGTAVIGVTNSSINTAVREDGFHVIGGGSATITLNVSGSSFTHNHSVQLKAHAEDSSTVTATVTDNTFDGQPAIVGNVGIDLAVRDRASLSFTVNGTLAGSKPTTSTQTFLPIRGQVINVYASGGGTAVGTIEGNDIQGSELAAGIRVVAVVTDVDGATPGVTLNPAITVKIKNNDISGIKGSGLAGIHIEAEDGNNSVNGVASVHATVDDNYVTSIANADSAIQVYVSDITANHANITCVNVKNNFASGTGGLFGDTDFYYGNPPGGGSSNGTGQMQGYSGSVAATWAANGNSDGGHFVGSEGSISSGTCNTVPSSLQLLAIESQKEDRDGGEADTHAGATALAGEKLTVDRARSEAGLQPETAAAATKAGNTPPHDLPQTQPAARTTFKPSQANPAADVDVALGTMNPGQQTTITFRVTINTPTQVNELVSQVCAQGSVSADSGIAVLTDDPDVNVSPPDPTCTALQGGVIHITNTTDPAGGTGFGFTDNIAAPNSFSLDDGQTKAFNGVAAGSYTVSENDPTPQYYLNELQCDDTASAVASTPDAGTFTATINLEPGETVLCTFTNGVDPTAVTLTSMTAKAPQNAWLPVWLIFGLLLTLLFVYRRQQP